MCAGLLALLVAPIHAMEKEEEEVTTIQTGPVTSYALSSETLATSKKAAKIVALWNTKSKKKVKEIKPSETVGNATQVALTSNSEKLAVAYDQGFLVLFDVETGKEIRKIAMQQQDCNKYLSFNTDGTSVLTSWAQYDTQTGKIETTFSNENPLVSISPDGKWGGAIESYNYKPICTYEIYNLNTYEKFTFEGQNNIHGLPFTLTNQGWANVSQQYDPAYQAQLYEYEAKQTVIQRFTAPNMSIDALTRDPQNKCIAGLIKKNKKIMIWDIKSGNPTQTIESEDPLMIKFCGDGAQLAIASANSIEVVDLK